MGVQGVAADFTVTRECEQCGETYTRWRGNPGRFCSHHCFAESLRRRPRPGERTCETCGAKFVPEPHNAGRFCTRRCAYDARRKHPKPEPRPCVACGTIFTPQSSTDVGRFCTPDCYHSAQARYPEPGERECAREGCENRFRPTPSHAAATGARFCTWSCWMLHAWQTGEAPARGAARTKAGPRTRQRLFGRWDGHLGKAAGVEGGRSGGHSVTYSTAEAAEVWRLRGEGLSSRQIAERVFGDSRYYKRVLRCLKN